MKSTTTAPTAQAATMKFVNSRHATSKLRGSVNPSFLLHTYIAPDGEHYSQLCRAGERFPLFYPTAYCSRSLRQRYTHSTQKEHLASIKKLYEWAEINEIDLQYRIVKYTFFTPHEYDSLINFISKKKSSIKKDCISKSKINSCIASIARYMKWLSNEINKNAHQSDNSKAIDNMVDALTARKMKPGSSLRSEQRILEKKVDEAMRQVLEELFTYPIKETRKIYEQGVMFRNILAIRILYDTGMRVGELLSLRLIDFNPDIGGDQATLEIHRNHDDPYDDRKRQPVAKTSGRPLPISKELSQMIEVYLKKWRRNIPNAGFSDNDFIIITHKKGKRQGKGLEYSSLQSGIINLKRKYPALSGLHPHLLRHDWNYRFSSLATKLGINSIKEQTTREFLMGWIPGSTSASRYNRRHIQKDAFELGIKIASHTSSRKKPHE